MPFDGNNNLNDEDDNIYDNDEEVHSEDNCAENTCGKEDNDAKENDNAQEDDEADERIEGEITPLQALHGLDKSLSLSNKTAGLPGLQQVYSVVPTALMSMKPGTVEPTVAFRPAVCNGLSDDQIEFVLDIKSQIWQMKTRNGLPRCQGIRNKWTGTNLSQIDFVSFKPGQLLYGVDKMVYDSMSSKKMSYQIFDEAIFQSSKAWIFFSESSAQRF